MQFIKENLSTIVKIAGPIIGALLAFSIKQLWSAALANQSEIDKIERDVMSQKSINHPKQIFFIFWLVGMVAGIAGRIYFAEQALVFFFVIAFLSSNLAIRDKRNTNVFLIAASTFLVAGMSYCLTYAIQSSEANIAKVFTFAFAFILLFLASIILYSFIPDFIKRKYTPRDLILVFSSGEILLVKLLSMTKDRDYIVQIINNCSENVIYPTKFSDDYIDEIVVNRSQIQKVICIKKGVRIDKVFSGLAPSIHYALPSKSKPNKLWE
ncbi:hypothetical protein FHS18_001169 [Paenibacillus phyllosphaerae]|uniref:Uncharacterized protein n=1 Tax=Paenibacillus phyllosphaerae TaxID=274593 RepID=A0A7W5AUW5_9BACL|nr:hypothetical protein [Paenibacillus phyllosphaerae]